MGLLLALLVPMSAALTVYEDDFDAYTTSSLSGTGGWQTAYSSDAWSASGVDYIFAKTDDSGGTWGSGGAADNQLVYTTESWTDHSVAVELYSNDDDCIGVSFRRQDASNFYIVLFAQGDGCPGTGTGARATFTGSRLYRVSGGSATQLDSSATTYTTSRWHDLQVDVDGSAITVWFDDDRNGVFEAADEILSATDATFSSGNVGLFCYDNGAPYGTAGGCAFDDVVVDQDDTDGDGVPDVDDICPSASDASQTDTDGDGTGDACDTDADGDGATSTASGGTDCDDADASVNPSATESCSTTADDDCDGSTNDPGATGCSDWYADADADGYGTGAASCRCRATTTYSVSNASDCDDGDATISPVGTETCDDIDQDCDGAVDDAAVDPATWYVDADGDGYGDATGTASGCDAPTGYVATGDDCNDLSPEVSPVGVEVCDGVDQDCDGATDEDAADAATWYADADDDGHGDPADSYVGCAAEGWVSGAGDCDPLDGTISPDALETCDGVDEDCDGAIDEEATDATVWYTDADGDGYGDDATAVYDCDGGGQGVNVGGDCDDGDPARSPGEPEVADGVDQDCDGRADNGLDTDGDGLDDDVEWETGTDPENPDTDGDGLDDGEEVDAGTDPNDPDDPGDDPGDTDDDPLDTGDPGVPGVRTGGFYGGGCATPGVPASLAGALLAAAALTRRRR